MMLLLNYCMLCEDEGEKAESYLPCWIVEIPAPRSGRRTWSGSTSTGSRSRLQTWSCGKYHRLARRPGERQNPPPPMPAGSPSPCSWTTAAGYLWKE